MKKIKHEYSPHESTLLSILQGGKQFTISQLSERLYKGSDQPPHARHCVRVSLHRLGGKLAANREKIALWKEPRKGPREINYWVE